MFNFVSTNIFNNSGFNPMNNIFAGIPSFNYVPALNIGSVFSFPCFEQNFSSGANFFTMPNFFAMPNFFSFPSFPSFNFTMPTFGNAKSEGIKSGTISSSSRSIIGGSALNTKMVNKAHSYVGVVNSSAQGNALFSPKNYKNTQWYRTHGRWGWCCDFAVYCAKDTLGSRYPKDMITSSPACLVSGAKNHNAYMSVPSTGKNSWLSGNVKPGDIIYMKGNGDSGKHIAVVKSVDSNGRIAAISGNSKGKVRDVSYNINTSGIYGFISLERLAA